MNYELLKQFYKMNRGVRFLNKKFQPIAFCYGVPQKPVQKDFSKIKASIADKFNRSGKGYFIAVIDFFLASRRPHMDDFF